MMTKEKLKEIVNICWEKVFKETEGTEQFRLSDEAIKAALEKFPDNINKINVTIKVVLINALYSTRIYKWEMIARHIVSKNIDAKIRNGDLSVVNDIRTGHGIKKKGTEINLYSFATKYAHWHNPEKYPIFDNLVKKLLCTPNSKFYTGRSDFSSYEEFKTTIDKLFEYLGLDESFKYRKLDHALWIYAKYKNKALPDELWGKLNEAISAIK